MAIGGKCKTSYFPFMASYSLTPGTHTHGDHGGVTLSSLIGRVGKADQRVFCMKKLREWVDAQYISRRETLANKQVIQKMEKVGYFATMAICYSF